MRPTPNPTEYILRRRAARKRWRDKVGRDAVREYHRAYYREHREKIRRREKELRHGPDRAANEKAYCVKRRFVKSEYDMIWSRLPEVVERRKLRYLARREIILARQKSRHAIKSGAPEREVRIIENFVERTKLRGIVICYYCSTLAPSMGCHIDHIIPLCRGGKHSIDNLCISCERCNCSKGPRFLSEWHKLGQQVFNF